MPLRAAVGILSRRLARRNSLQGSAGELFGYETVSYKTNAKIQHGKASGVAGCRPQLGKVSRSLKTALQQGQWLSY